MYKSVDGSDPKLEYLKMDPDFDGFKNSISFEIEGMAISNGLPPDIFEVTGNRTATEITVIDKKLIGIKKKFEDIFTEKEKEIFEMDLRLLDNLNLHKQQDLDYLIEFIEEKQIVGNVTPDDLIKLETGGYIDKAEVRQKLAPTTTYDEAIVALEQIENSKEPEVGE